MESICEKEYAPFMEGLLQRMVNMPIEGICVLIKMEDNAIYSDYYNSRMTDKMIYASVIQQDVTWDILKANNMVGRDEEEKDE